MVGVRRSPGATILGGEVAHTHRQPSPSGPPTGSEVREGFFWTVLLHGCDVAASVFYALSRQSFLFVHFVAATSALCRGTSPDHLLLIGIVSPSSGLRRCRQTTSHRQCSIVVTELTFDRYTLRRILMLSPPGLAMSFCHHRDFPHLHSRATLTEHVSASLGGNSHSNITEAALQLWWTLIVCSASGGEVSLV